MPRDNSQDHLELRKLREGFAGHDGKPLTQVQMAQLLDVSTPTYSRWERNERPVPYAVLELMRIWAREQTAARKGGRRKKH